MSLLLLATCQEQPDGRPMTQQEMEERLMEMNRQLTDDEKKDIDRFIKKQKWPMKATGTGLRYWIYTDVEGETPSPGQLAEVSFSVSLLDGTECYKTEEGETRTFKVEQADVETGLHEAIQYMSPGDSAKLILPSHLAYGLAGDMNKIPLKSTLVYDLVLHSLR
jgi:FKBP-type peptidyl-prolyl cis-trans isomerase FkpA